MNARHLMAAAAAFLSLLSLAACQSATPTSPGALTLTGVWSGAVVESYGGSGRLRLDIEQVQFALIGSFSLEFADASFNRSGTITGSVASASSARRMQLTSPDAFDCQPGQSRDGFLLLSWTQAGDMLSGSYQGFACVGTITGTFEAVRER